MNKCGSCEEGTERGVCGSFLEEVNLGIEDKGCKAECVSCEHIARGEGHEAPGTRDGYETNPRHAGSILEVSLQVTLGQKS